MVGNKGQLYGEKASLSNKFPFSLPYPELFLFELQSFLISFAFGIVHYNNIYMNQNTKIPAPIPLKLNMKRKYCESQAHSSGFFTFTKITNQNDQQDSDQYKLPDCLIQIKAHCLNRSVLQRAKFKYQDLKISIQFRISSEFYGHESQSTVQAYTQ